jgi:hypothetical protein
MVYSNCSLPGRNGISTSLVAAPGLWEVNETAPESPQSNRYHPQWAIVFDSSSVYGYFTAVSLAFVAFIAIGSSTWMEIGVSGMWYWAILSDSTRELDSRDQFIEHMTGIRKIDNWSRTVDWLAEVGNPESSHKVSAMMVLRVSEARSNLIGLDIPTIISRRYSKLHVSVGTRSRSLALCGEQESFEKLVMESFWPVIC